MSAHPPRLVVVDDEPEVCAILVRMLARLYPEHQVDACADSAAALAAIATGSVMCVITDYALGADTGVALAQSIRARWPMVPVILLTGLLTSEIAAAAVAAGCIAILDKPVTLATLRTTLQSLF